MAKTPTDKQITRAQTQTEKEILEKRQAYLDAGKKPFVYNSYGPGVMPQEVFDQHRDPSDPDYKPKEV